MERFVYKAIFKEIVYVEKLYCHPFEHRRYLLIKCFKAYKTLKGDLMSLRGIDVCQRDAEVPSFSLPCSSYAHYLENLD